MFRKKLNLFAKMSIFKKLLIKLTKVSLFSAIVKLIMQTDGCLISGSIPVVFSDI